MECSRAQQMSTKHFNLKEKKYEPGKNFREANNLKRGKKNIFKQKKNESYVLECLSER